MSTPAIHKWFIWVALALYTSNGFADKSRTTKAKFKEPLSSLEISQISLAGHINAEDTCTNGTEIALPGLAYQAKSGSYSSCNFYRLQLSSVKILDDGNEESLKLCDSDIYVHAKKGEQGVVRVSGTLSWCMHKTRTITIERGQIRFQAEWPYSTDMNGNFKIDDLNSPRGSFSILYRDINGEIYLFTPPLYPVTSSGVILENQNAWLKFSLTNALDSPQDQVSTKHVVFRAAPGGLRFDLPPINIQNR